MRAALWTLDIPLTQETVGTAEALYVPTLLRDHGIALGETNAVEVTGVPESVHVRLASGNSGVIAAVNEVVAEWEIPTLLVVYAMVIVVVYLSYFDWRATLCCLVPLTISTFLGLWFMTAMGIGLKVSTLPVLVLSVGIGVDYAFYIYNRLECHLAIGKDTPSAFRRAMFETGMAVVFTALTLAIGVATWSFSPLKFQADMGLLMAFMFVINMVMAITVLPAWALALERIVPRPSLKQAEAPAPETADA
jgi:predicted RND superfamily exporter protein